MTLKQKLDTLRASYEKTRKESESLNAKALEYKTQMSNLLLQEKALAEASKYIDIRALIKDPPKDIDSYFE